jgi:hypothetical protein
MPLPGPALRVRAKLDGVTDPVALVALSAEVARAIYESERAALGLMRASAFFPALRKAEQEFEDLRYSMQEAGRDPRHEPRRPVGAASPAHRRQGRESE